MADEERLTPAVAADALGMDRELMQRYVNIAIMAGVVQILVELDYPGAAAVLQEVVDVETAKTVQ